MSGGDWKELFNAGCEGDLALVEYHVKCGVDVNDAHPEFLSTPLVGANPHLPSEFDGVTPMQAARRAGLARVEDRLGRLRPGRCRHEARLSVSVVPYCPRAPGSCLPLSTGAVLAAQSWLTKVSSLVSTQHARREREAGRASEIP